MIRAKLENRKKLKRTDPNFVYYESHHIVPDCFFISNRSKGKNPGWLEGDSNIKENLVLLTAREHFVAHQMLIKIYPKHNGLALSLHKMIHAESDNQIRNNRDFEWIKKKISSAISKQNTGLGKGRIVSAETRKKLSDFRKGTTQSTESNKNRSEKQKGISKPSMKGKIPWNKGGTHSDETKKKISERRVGRKFGPQSEEHIFKRTAHRKDQPNLLARVKVLCIETGEIFESIRSAAAWVGAKHQSSISKAARNTDRFTCYGYHWKIIEN